MKIRAMLICLLMVISAVTSAQKVKYKDIFEFLEKKQYDVAEPLLKKYLETEQENPNAFLYMGIITMEKYAKMDPADAQAMAVRDEAVRYLHQAKQGITEKEVSKNEKYYAIYRRRNIRTGEMGVIHGDVITDIEGRISRLMGDSSGN